MNNPTKRSPIGGIITVDLEPMFQSVCEFVKSHQGEKGYIDTQDDGADTIYTIVYDEVSGLACEKRVHGVRWNEEEKDLEIVYDDIVRTYVITYSDDDFKNSENWHSVKWSDVYYIHTIFQIAENIEEYVEEK